MGGDVKELLYLIRFFLNPPIGFTKILFELDTLGDIDTESLEDAKVSVFNLGGKQIDSDCFTVLAKEVKMDGVIDPLVQFSDKALPGPVVTPFVLNFPK